MVYLAAPIFFQVMVQPSVQTVAEWETAQIHAVIKNKMFYRLIGIHAHLFLEQLYKKHLNRTTKLAYIIFHTFQV